MNTTLRFILAVFAGVLAGGTIVGAVEALGHWIYPPPELADSEAFCEYISSAPILVLLFPLIAWILGSFAAGFVGKLVYRSNNKPAFVAGGFFLIFILWNFFAVLCHPTWIEVLGAIVPVPMAMLGARMLATG